MYLVYRQDFDNMENHSPEHDKVIGVTASRLDAEDFVLVANRGRPRDEVSISGPGPIPASAWAETRKIDLNVKPAKCAPEKDRVGPFYRGYDRRWYPKYHLVEVSDLPSPKYWKPGY